MATKYDAHTLVLTENELKLEREQAKSEIIIELAKRGFDNDTLAVVTGVKLEIINKIVLREKLSPAEEEIADMTKRVMVKALNMALDTLDRGSPEARYQIMIRMLGPATKFIGQGNNEGSEMASALQMIMEAQRALEP